MIRRFGIVCRKCTRLSSPTRRLIVLLINFSSAGTVLTVVLFLSNFWLFFLKFLSLSLFELFVSIVLLIHFRWAGIIITKMPMWLFFFLFQNIKNIRNIQGIQNSQSFMDIQNSSDNQGIELNLFKRCRPHECSFLVSCNFPLSRFVWNVLGNFCHQKSTVVPLSMMVLF